MARFRAVTTPRLLAIATLVLASMLAACSITRGSAVPTVPGAAAASPTPTLNPNQLEELRRSMGATPTPVVRPTPPAVTPTPSSTIPAPGPTQYDPALAAMLPRTLRGIPLSIFSVPMAPFAGGGDMCIVLCADEPGRLAKASGRSIDDMSVGLAIPPDGSGFAAGVIAIRFRGIDGRSVVGVRLGAGSHSTNSGPPQTRDLHVGSRPVVWATWFPFYEERQGEYLTSTGDVLFIVQGLPPGEDGTVPGDVALLIEALP
jgi:hypothetical protein